MVQMVEISEVHYVEVVEKIKSGEQSKSMP
jgi:hypothetical protein